MGFASSLCGLLVKLLVVGIASLLVLSFLPLSDIEAPAFELDDPVVFDGALQENRLLSNAELLFNNKVRGPESLAEHKGDLYSGLVGGRIVKLPRNGDEPVLVANVTGSECDFAGLWDQKKCGRPLGLRFDAKGDLFVVDAFLGIKKIDIRTGAVETIFDPRGVSVDEQEIIFLDDMAIDENAGSKGGHVFYLTDVSKKHDLDSCFISIITLETSGRVLKYDADSKKVSVVAKGIAFPNGIELVDDKQAVIVSEIATRKLLRVMIKGPDSGKKETLNSNLPCAVDNVRRSARKNRETYWLACFGAHKQRDLADDLRKFPFLTKAVLRFSYNTGWLLMKIGELLHADQIRDFGYHVKGGELILLTDSVKKAGLIVEADKNGRILNSLQDPEGKVSYFSEVHEIAEGNKRVLYLASFVNPYIVKVAIESDPLAAEPSTAKTAAPSTPEATAKSTGTTTAKPSAKPAGTPTTTTKTPVTAKPVSKSATTPRPQATKEPAAGKKQEL